MCDIYCTDSHDQNYWIVAQDEISMLQELGKVLYYQPYAPKDIDPRKRPFVIVIQDEFMRDVAKKFSPAKSWAVDSTFKTNQYGLPLYAAIVPNQDGIGMPVFYMLCSNDVKEGHEGIALELALTHAFQSIGEVWPLAIVIDKHMTSLNAINNVVNNDSHCWIIEGNNKVHVAGRVLLCHFHVLKAWNENLLIRVPQPEKQRVWQGLNVLMHCPNEDHFDENVRRFLLDFDHIPTFRAYISMGWTGFNIPWRRL